MGKRFYSSSSICLEVSNLVLDRVCHLSFLRRRNWLHRGTWRCELFPSLDVLVRIYEFQLFLRGLVVIIVLVLSSGLRGVVQSHGPKWNVEGVVVIVLH